MAPYQYDKLVNDQQDIRLLLLRPGHGNDDLCATLAHTALTISTPSPSKRLSLHALRPTLPEGWRALETLDNRYIFEHPERDLTTWEHPDSSVSVDLYQDHPATTGTTGEGQYEALSYTWGSADNPSVLLVESDDGNDGHSTLKIQQNLAVALRDLRLPDTTRTLWVDAVCINQDDIPERNTQVTRMSDIYQQAASVVAWLGPASSDSRAALAALKQIGQQVVLSKCNTRLRDPDAAHADWFESGSILPFAQSTWDATLALVSRPWFDRVWIVQEIQLARARTAKIQCGSDSLAWPRFTTAARCIFRKSTSPHPPLTQRLAAIKMLTQSLEGVNFRHLLYGCSNRLCTDKRDHVYGLLGLASSAIRKHIKPDYASPVASIYTDAFLAILSQSKRLDALWDCALSDGDDRSRPENLPSWVPNWSRSIESLAGVLNSIYSGSGVSEAHAVFLSPNILEVQAVYSGTVSSVHNAVPKIPSDVLQAIQQWAQPLSAAPGYPTRESALTAYALALSMGMVRNRFPMAGVLLPTLAELETELDVYIRAPPPPQDGATAAAPPRTFRQMITNVKGRSFVTTKEGYLGLGPPHAQEGDLIYTILGCRDLILLRPDANTKTSHVVIGCCHVHGLSDGESLLGPLPSPWLFRVKMATSGGGHRVHFFHDSATGEDRLRDPRLGPLPDGLEEITMENAGGGEAERVAWLRDKVTGETVHNDPGLSLAALQGRGVNVEIIQLI